MLKVRNFDFVAVKFVGRAVVRAPPAVFCAFAAWQRPRAASSEGKSRVA